MPDAARKRQSRVFPHWSGLRRFWMCRWYGIVYVLDGLTIFFLGRSWDATYKTALWSAKRRRDAATVPADHGAGKDEFQVEPPMESDLG